MRTSFQPKKVFLDTFEIIMSFLINNENMFQ